METRASVLVHLCICLLARVHEKVRTQLLVLTVEATVWEFTQ